jgi:hypothetical protein
VQPNFKKDVKEIYHQSDQVTLKNVEFSVNEINYFQVSYGPENEADKACQLQSIVKAVDHGQISRDSYRDIAAAEIHLPHEYTVSNERITITNHTNQLIKISLVDTSRQNNLEEITETNEPDITNPEITWEVMNTIGIGIHRSAKDILSYIIPQLKKKKVLNSSDPTIRLRVSGDGRNVE